MAQRFRSVMVVVFGCVTLWQLAGCTVTLTDDGALGFRQTTSWEFFHRATTTNSDSSSCLDVPSLEEWFKAQQTPEPEGDDAAITVEQEALADEADTYQPAGDGG